MSAAIVGALFGPVLGAAADVIGPQPAFCTVGAAGLALMAWAWSTPARGPTRPPRAAALVEAVRDPEVVRGIWLMSIPGLLFGTIGVLAPLRMDELGAGAVAIAACFLAAAGLEAFVTPVAGRVSDRRGRLVPAMAGLAGGALMMALMPWPQAAWLLGALIVLGDPVIGVLWAPAIAIIADGAERHGIEQAIGFSLVNVAWAVGQTAGAAGSARLADATGDEVPYLLLCAACVITLATIRRRAVRIAR
jgi:predicted MFS family arabinose efflux permease